MQHKTLVIAIAVCALAHVADAKPKAKPKQSAKAHVDKATKAHKEGKFDVALTELKAAYEIDPQPKLLFAIAQVYAKLDDCPNAVENYEKFLDKTKDKKKQEVVKQAIAACKAKPDVFASAKPDDKKPDDKKPDDTNSDVFRKAKPVEETTTTPPPPPVETTPPPPPPVETAPPPPTPPMPVVKDEPLPPGPAATTTTKRPFYKDVLGDALVVGGVAVGVFSFIEYRGAVGKLDDAEHEGSLDAYEQDLSDAHDKRKLSLILAGGSVALVGAGMLRYALHTGTETRRVALVPTSHGGLITWTGGF